MNDINCPYCDAELDICHDDGFGYAEGEKHQMECDKCNKTFVFETSISFYYEPEKADCLNDGNHDYKLSHTIPNAFSTMVCSMCDDKRELTEEERIKHGLQTKDEYFNSLKS